jgi:flagellar biosynthesis anti-sigma factor FlgM
MALAVTGSMRTRIGRIFGMIDGLGRMLPPWLPAADAGAATPADNRARPGTGGEDVALALPGLVAAMAARPPVDMARVEALREAIGEGRYRPDPAGIAAALVGALLSERG